MKHFRINIYLKIKHYFFCFFIKEKNLKKKLDSSFKSSSKKKYFLFTSQLRVAFLILLKYLNTLKAEHGSLKESRLVNPKIISFDFYKTTGSVASGFGM